jgi:Radical SAM superfamily
MDSRQRMLQGSTGQIEQSDCHHIAAQIKNVLSAPWGYMDATGKIAAHQERLSLFLSGAEDDITPANIEIWPSLTCTARCHSCPYIRNGARQTADRTLDHDYLMSVELWGRLAAEFSAAGGLSVTFTGGGEPTVNKNLATFAAIARQNGLEWGLYTNGASLTPGMIDDLLAHNPTFIRVSINSGSPAAHHALYRLGAEAYGYIQKMVSHMLRRTRAGGSSIGLGYVMTHAAPSELTGIREFCVDLATSSGRPVDYIAIRPALTYYDRSGIPVPVQPRAPNFGDIPSHCREMLAETCERIGTKLQIGDRAFEALANARESTVCSATQWATSSTERGDLYLLSEANGGTSKELRQLCYGALADRMSFGELWRSPNRRRLSQEFSRGVRRPPAWHKLAELSIALESIRRSIGILNPLTARQVSALLSADPKPAHWKFI